MDSGFLTRLEGFRQNLYNDAAGHCTIGVGHLVHKGNCTAVDKQTYPQCLSVDEVKNLLRHDVVRFERAVMSLVKVSLAQHQFDALVSFAFNLGVGGFARATFLEELNRGNYLGVPAGLKRYNQAGGRVVKGLVRRREAETNLFSTGRYDA